MGRPGSPGNPSCAVARLEGTRSGESYRQGRTIMRRWQLAACLAAVGVAVLAGFFVAPALVRAKAGEKVQEEARLAALPISQVVLFSSGVGYFQREGSVEGDTRVDLSFDVRDINDLLKSMVLRDLDKGHITAVSYDSLAPLERTLGSVAVNLTGRSE